MGTRGRRRRRRQGSRLVGARPRLSPSARTLTSRSRGGLAPPRPRQVGAPPAQLQLLQQLVGPLPGGLVDAATPSWRTARRFSRAVRNSTRLTAWNTHPGGRGAELQDVPSATRMPQCASQSWHWLDGPALGRTGRGVHGCSGRRVDDVQPGRQTGTATATGGAPPWMLRRMSSSYPRSCATCRRGVRSSTPGAVAGSAPRGCMPTPYGHRHRMVRVPGPKSTWSRGPKDDGVPWAPLGSTTSP